MVRGSMLLASLLALSPCAGAADFDYTYAEASFTSVSPAHTGTSLSGATADGSYALSDTVHGFAGFQHVSCCDSSENTFDAGAGWNTRLQDRLGLFIDGEVLSTNGSGNGNHTGWGASGGLRAILALRFELDGFTSHTDVGGDTHNTLGVRALYDLDDHWRVFAAYANEDTADTFMLGARFVF